jgi:hypothetical protein
LGDEGRDGHADFVDRHTARSAVLQERCGVLADLVCDDDGLINVCAHLEIVDVLCGFTDSVPVCFEDVNGKFIYVSPAVSERRDAGKAVGNEGGDSET